MDIGPIFPAKLQKLWNALELRFLVLFSLFLQVLLIATGNRRKYSKNKLMAAILWLSYLSADSVATLALGVLSQAEGDSNGGVVDPKYTITVFWAPFLLMHLGGPDTITAYALADNELWSRHLLGLFGQVFVAVYVFLRSFTRAHLDFLWIVIFSTGIVKYGERSWVLYCASKDQFRDSMISRPDPGPNYAKFMDELVSRESEGYRVSLGKAIDNIPSSNGKGKAPSSNGKGKAIDNIPSSKGKAPSSNGKAIDNIPSSNDNIPSSNDPEANVVQRIPDDILLPKAYSFFGTFKKLFADLILSFQDRETSVSFFKNLHWKDAFSIVEIELGLVSDLFYTKLPLVFSRAGVFLRVFSCSSTIAVLIGFIIIKKKGYPHTEVIITYILLAGAIFLEFYAILLLALSDRRMISSGSTWANRPANELPKPVSLLFYLRIVPSKRRWSNSIGQYNVLNHCLEYMPNRTKMTRWYPKKFDQCCENFNQYLEKNLFWRNVPVPDDIKENIFDQLKERAKVGRKQSDSYWKDKILLEEMNCFNENDEVEFDQSLLLWHLATDICYTKVEQPELGENVKSVSKRCMLLSNYMVHLLIMSPFMLPSGIGQIRFQDTCAEAREIFNFENKLSKEQACKMLSHVDARFVPSDVKGDRSKSLLFDARRLSKSLNELDVGRRWDKINEAWLNMLSFAAAQCSWSDHAEKLSQGGELLTHVWLLMAHFGLTDQFQISKGYIRAKLELK